MWTKSSRLRHPLYPNWKPAKAEFARGSHQVLAGTFLQLWHAGLRGAAATRALYLVIREDSSPWVAESEREMLWRLFEVPILGLLIDAQEEVLAYECEAQQGLHVNALLAPLQAAAFESGVCSCGRSGQRLVPAASTFSAAERELPAAV
jgi:hypothetical protein